MSDKLRQQFGRRLARRPEGVKTGRLSIKVPPFGDYGASIELPVLINPVGRANLFRVRSGHMGYRSFRTHS